MKAFTFRLEKVLQIRTFYEEKAKIELGRCISEAEKIKGVLKKIADEKVLARKQMTFAHFQMQTFLASETYLKNLDAKKELMLKELVQAELKVEKARAAYLEMSKKRKVLSKLKEKKFEAWKKEYAHETDVVYDDIVNSKACRDE